MRFNWEIGSYYDAGMRVGNVWSIEIGQPDWVDNQSHSEKLVDEKEEAYPLADFYGAYFEELYQEKFYDEINGCLVPDELHMRAHDLFIVSLEPYDHFAYQKYFAAMHSLSEFNFAPCSEIGGLLEILNKDS